MLTKTIERLSYLLDNIPALLANVPGDEFSHKPSETKWSKKEILGHLIDSAANNHQRFVRVQFQDLPHIIYQQDDWVRCSFHQQLAQTDVIKYWEIQNRHILFIISHMPAERLLRKCMTNETEPVTLQWLIEDYVVHMEHHLQQIISYQ
jgi:hypothetical protein